MVSVYYHDTLPIIESTIRKNFVYRQCKKFVISYDFANNFNTLLNTGQEKKDTYWPLEGDILDLIPLLNAGGVIREDHLEKFLDVAYEEAEKDGSVKERAKAINNRWHDMALVLRKDLED